MLPAGGDFREGSKDDQVLQVQVVFNGGKHTLSYIWDTTAPKAATKESNYFGYRTRVIVAESGAANLNKWNSVSVNYLNDYTAYFGEDSTAKVSLVRVQINAQHTRSSGEGYIGNISFKKN